MPMTSPSPVALASSGAVDVPSSTAHVTSVAVPATGAHASASPSGHSRCAGGNSRPHAGQRPHDERPPSRAASKNGADASSRSTRKSLGPLIAAWLPSTSVLWKSSTPPLPLTIATSWRGTWRSPPWPRTWMTASDSGVMPHR